jgi:L-2-hydroxyglutarate oxidase LhgO
MEQIDCLVVGAGVVGLAAAKALAEAGREVLIAESQARFGSGISSRNSEVIHAGLYYPTGSLKARACVQGKQWLYAYCRERGIDHRRCGKLLVAATPTEVPKLRTLQTQGQANGVGDLQWLSADQARALEPQLHCVAALHSPSSGIVDSHGLMLALLADAQAHGAVLGVNTQVLGAQASEGGWVVNLRAPEQMQLHCRWLINCAGLCAVALASKFQGLPQSALPRLYLAQGHYFALNRPAPFSRLIYPVPADAGLGGLGVHLTLDLSGQARFGPDVQWLDHAEPERIDWRVDAQRTAAFRASIASYWPALLDLPADALAPAYSGVRPKLSAAGETAADFMVQGPLEHGVPGLVNLFGIESPGLTACGVLGQDICATVVSGAQAGLCA